MLATSAPARQQAHDLVDRMTPVQLSAFIDLFEPLTVSAANRTCHAPFCDELPLDADDASSFCTVARAGHAHQAPRIAPASAHPGDLDTWPASMKSRSSYSRTTAA